MRFRSTGLIFCACLGVVSTGCRKDEGKVDVPKREVVVYTALDRSFSEPILDEFTRQTGITVRAQYDTESTKTVGLANRIRAERARPRCDVFWNNEILNTLQLKAEGLLEPCDPPEAKNYPDAWKDPERYWYGFAARARVIIVNTELITDDTFPASIYDLADPRWKGKTGIAKPLFGTTASHVACLFAALGPDRATEYLDSLKSNEVQIHGGNKGCATAVAGTAAAFALTDTDDAIIEVEAGRPVRIVYPDSTEDAIGTLFLPNTLAI
ncbi:MAG: extracellular solute-binding protein, partial [Phycisphaerae bacterium]